MKLKEVILLTLIVLLIGAIGTVLANYTYSSWYFLEQTSIPLKFKVTEGAQVGFDLNDTVLAFGKVPQGQMARREIYLGSEVRSKAYIAVDPPLEAWVYPVEASVHVDPDEPREVTMKLEVPQDAPPGNYTGRVVVTYFRRLS